MPKPVIAAVSDPQFATTPKYDRAELKCGVAHIGVGNFHRAHFALYMHELLNRGAGDWMIHGIGCLEGDKPLIAAMNSQDNLYTLMERSGDEDKLKLIGSIKEFTHAPSDPHGVIDLLASDDIKIISMTITEKGYCSTPNGELDTEHPLIKPDLDKGATPRSAIGYLYAAAEQRMRNGGKPVTVMSCDNIQGNGHMTKRLLSQFAALKDPAVKAWIHDNVSFPNSMVDRITPAVTPETAAFVETTWGIEDKCPVMSESYLQWVVEDDFIAGRPEFGDVGVEVVQDVKPYEIIKTTLLNGAHSALSYISYLLGHRKVDAAMNDELVEQYVRRYMDEVTPTVPRVPDLNVEDYKVSLRQRFANPAVSDQVMRLAQEGSVKFRNFMFKPLREQLEANNPIPWESFALAAWTRFLVGADEFGEPIEIDDPNRATLQGYVKGTDDDAAHLLSATEIFDADLATNERLVDTVSDCYKEIRAIGTRAALANRLAATN